MSAWQKIKIRLNRNEWDAVTRWETNDKGQVACRMNNEHGASEWVKREYITTKETR